MKKVLVILSVAMVFFAEAQVTKYQKIIDSIGNKNWKNSMLDLDSLENPKIFDLLSFRKDSIQLPINNIIVSHTEDTSPMTSSSIVNLPPLRRWFVFGQNSLVFNQSSFSNWNAGGNDNIGIIGKVNYNIIYKRKRHYLDNNIQLGYGFVSSTGQSTRKTDDYINVMTNYGYALSQQYYFSAGFQFITQFTAGYNYSKTPNPTLDNRISRFMAPGYFNIGAGFSYNPNDNLQFIFRPINGKFTFVFDKKLQTKGTYGLEYDGQSFRGELGAMFNVLYKIKIYKDINLVNQINFFSNYLEHSERVDVSYSGNLELKFNKYISGIVSINMIYDHDQIQKLQRKQTLGFGLNYNLGYKIERDNTTGIIKPFDN